MTTGQEEKITNTLALLVGWKELDTLFQSNIRGMVEVNNIFLIVYYNVFAASILSSLNKFPLWLWFISFMKQVIIETLHIDVLSLSLCFRLRQIITSCLYSFTCHYVFYHTFIHGGFQLSNKIKNCLIMLHNTPLPPPPLFFFFFFLSLYFSNCYIFFFQMGCGLMSILSPKQLTFTLNIEQFQSREFSFVKRQLAVIFSDYKFCEEKCNKKGYVSKIHCLDMTNKKKSIARYAFQFLSFIFIF